MMKKFMAVFAVVAIVAFASPAFAANPFMDVPAGHWAYDAVAQLASRGIASGYPDGSFKGTQPATRYEMASMVARALAQVDMEKAGKQDVELLKRLVLEFKNELNALGVKVNDLDKRVAVLEDGIGGWKIRGIFQFDAKFADSDTGKNKSLYSSNGKETEFDKERFRLFLTKTINENTYFYAQYRTGDSGAGSGINGRGDMHHMRWSHMYVDTKLPWDLGLRVGRFAVDFESDYGLYADNDALFGIWRTDGFQFKKSFGMLSATAVVGRNNTAGYRPSYTSADAGDHMTYMLDLNFRPNEKFFIGATGYWGVEDAAVVPATVKNLDADVNTYGFYAGYSFTPNIALKGIYYFQDLGRDITGGKIEDSPKAWKAILDVKQDALKFTSLWVEYMNMDNTFLNLTEPMYSIGMSKAAHILYNQPLNNETTKVLFVKAGQKWNDKWDTSLRFGWADYDTKGLDDSYEYGVGVGYQLNSAVKFELAYDYVDYGGKNVTSDRGKNNYTAPTKDAAGNVISEYSNYLNDKESVIRFRTTVSF